MNEYINRVCTVQVIRKRKYTPKLPAYERERGKYRCIAGVLHSLGQTVMPQAFLVASKMQQKLCALAVSHLLDAYGMVIYLKISNQSFYIGFHARTAMSLSARYLMHLTEPWMTCMGKLA